MSKWYPGRLTNLKRAKTIGAGGTSIGTVEVIPVACEPELTIKGATGNLNTLQGNQVRVKVTLAGQVVGGAETLLDGSCPVGSSVFVLQVEGTDLFVYTLAVKNGDSSYSYRSYA